MNINAHMLAARLEGVRSSRIASDPKRADLVFVQAYSPGCAPREGGIYVARADQLDAPLESPKRIYALVCLGQPPEFVYDDPHCDVICMSALPVDSVLQVIGGLLHDVQTWYVKILDIVASDRPDALTRILNTSAKFLSSPVELFNANFQIIAFGEVRGRYEYPRDIVDEETGYLVEPMFKYFGEDEALRLGQSLDEPQYHLGEGGDCTAYCNIFVDDCFVGRVVLVALYRDGNDGDLYLMGVLAKVISLYMKTKGFAAFSRGLNVQDAVAEYVLSETAVSPTRALAVIERIGWNRHDHFCASCIQPSAALVAARAVDYFARFLEASLPECVAFAGTSNVYLVHDIDKSEGDYEQFASTLESCLAEHGGEAGLGTVFTDFVDLPIFFRQAQALFRFGERTSTVPRRLYRFEDFGLQCLLREGFESLPLKAFVPEELLDLIEYDRAHDSDYCHTLRVYLEEGSSSATAARRLCINGGTLRYRMKRVADMLAHLDLDDPRIRTLLLCLFELGGGLGVEASSRLSFEEGALSGEVHVS